jgi:CheY-like chemotaxis protein
LAAAWTLVGYSLVSRPSVLVLDAPPHAVRCEMHCGPTLAVDDTRVSRMRIRMNGNGKTVLLVEDNEDNRIVYSTILRHFGYTVTEALNGEEGISKARAEKPDLILMDISIPIIDGWEATQVLKHDPETHNIPIIALTAHALASDREKAMEVGCDGYLAKPCEPRAVVAEVQRFLGRDNGA